MSKIIRFEIKSRAGSARYNGLLQFDNAVDGIKNVWVFFGGKAGLVQEGRIVGGARKPLMEATSLTESELVWYVTSAATLHCAEEPTTEELKTALLMELEAWRPGVVARLVASKASTVANACLVLNIPVGIAAILRNLRLEPIIATSFAESELLNAKMLRSWQVVETSSGGALTHDFVRSTNTGVATRFLLRRAGLGVTRRLSSNASTGERFARG